MGPKLRRMAEVLLEAERFVSRGGYLLSDVNYAGTLTKKVDRAEKRKANDARVASTAAKRSRLHCEYSNQFSNVLTDVCIVLETGMLRVL